jgi:hypothetical protein
VLQRAWRWSRKSHDERQSTEARARFWDEVREGEREAEAASTAPPSIGADRL